MCRFPFCVRWNSSRRFSWNARIVQAICSGGSRPSMDKRRAAILADFREFLGSAINRAGVNFATAKRLSEQLHGAVGAHGFPLKIIPTSTLYDHVRGKQCQDLPPWPWVANLWAFLTAALGRQQFGQEPQVGHLVAGGGGGYVLGSGSVVNGRAYTVVRNGPWRRCPAGSPPCWPGDPRCQVCHTGRHERAATKPRSPGLRCSWVGPSIPNVSQPPGSRA